MRYLYGNRGTSLYSEAEMYGQLVVYIIWALILVGLLVKSWKSKTRMWLLQSAMFSFVCALAFLCARFGTMVADTSVPIGYRFESAIVDMTWTAGLVLLFATLIHYTKAWKPLRLGFWAVWLIFAALSIAYVVLSFVLAGYGLNHFKEDWRWHISDRDFAQTLSKAAIDRLKRNGSIGLVFSYIQSLVWDIIDDGYAHSRDIQIKLGLAADIIAFLLALALIVPAAFAWLKKSHGLKSTVSAVANTIIKIYAHCSPDSSSNSSIWPCSRHALWAHRVRSICSTKLESGDELRQLGGLAPEFRANRRAGPGIRGYSRISSQLSHCSQGLSCSASSHPTSWTRGSLCCDAPI